MDWALLTATGAEYVQAPTLAKALSAAEGNRWEILGAIRETAYVPSFARLARAPLAIIVGQPAPIKAASAGTKGEGK